LPKTDPLEWYFLVIGSPYEQVSFAASVQGETFLKRPGSLNEAEK